jgi:DNA end-binding protein Ku
MAASAKTAARKRASGAHKSAKGATGAKGARSSKDTKSAESKASKGAPRVLWKGAISFGLVHIPVGLYTATRPHGVDFDWLDKRSMDPVGYKRINKRTGREVAREQIVKGVEYEDGQYVVLSDKEISEAYPKTTQTIAIESFVPATSIPFMFLERPYYLAPINRGGKVYALLRETLQRSGRVGVARVVIQSKEHLAMLVPSGPGLVLNLLRWGEDMRPWKALPLPPESLKAAGVSEREVKMAEALIKDMSADFDPEAFHDSFTEEIMKLVQRKAEAGKTESVTPLEPLEEGEGTSSAKILDLTELLQRSLRQGGGKKASANEKDEPEAGASGRKRGTTAAKSAKAAKAKPARARAPKSAARKRA